ncbi:MAG: PPC domain-containing protein [Acidobacteria bacterium]|nr:PPC domain-containing protein [Acidobacteriota bacterium]
MKPCSFLVLALLLVTSAPVSFGQSKRLRVGEPVRSRLTRQDKALDDGSHYRLYEFRAARGQSLTIELKSSDFDPYLTLFDGDGTEIVSAHDLTGNNIARIEITATYTGTYLMRINSMRGPAVGTYTLTVK